MYCPFCNGQLDSDYNCPNCDPVDVTPAYCNCDNCHETYLCDLGHTCPNTTSSQDDPYNNDDPYDNSYDPGGTPSGGGGGRAPVNG